MVDLDGVLVPCVTPFDTDGALDLDGYEQVVRFVLDAGVRGVIPGGTTGEYYAMRVDERVAVLRHTLEVVEDTAGDRPERVTTIAGCNAGATRDVLALATTAAELGYDAVMLAVPPTSLPTQDELVTHYTTVTEEAGLPVVLYDYPARAGRQIGLEAIDRLADLPGIVGIKESSGDLSRFHVLRRLVAGRMEICCGADDLAVDLFGWGVRSWIAGTANALPRHHVAVLDAANRGDLAGARRRFDGLLPWIQDCEAGGYNQKAKLGLVHQGVPAGQVRAPLQPLPDDAAAAHLALLDAALSVDPEQPRTVADAAGAR
jgi:4-hydroxy-tetrahydrodipicolinate synthase